MTKTTLQIVVAFLFISLFSCKKDNNNVNPAVLSGDWKFTSISGKSSDVVDGNDIDYTEYASTECTGIVNIDGSVMKYDSITYVVNGSQFIISYQNNIPDSNHISYSDFISAEHNTITTSFVTVGTDSIHFSSNYGLPGSGGNRNPPSDGAKFFISGDTLKLTSPFSFKASFDNTQTLSGTVVTILTRQ